MRAREEYLRDHPYCQWFISFYNLDESDIISNHGWFQPVGPCELEVNYRGLARVPSSTQIHHKRGRIGELLFNKEFFMAVGEDGHRYIHANVRESYERGWMMNR